MLRGGRTKHWMRAFYALRAGRQLKKASQAETGGRGAWGAGKSVADIDGILPAGEIVRRFADAARVAQ